MDFPPLYAQLMDLPALGVMGSWRVGRGRFFAWAMPTMADSLPTGWRLRISVEYKSVERAWDALRPVFKGWGLGGRVVLPEAARARDEPLGPSTGAMLTIFVDKIQEGGEAHALVKALEQVLVEAKCVPGLPILSDRPLPGSAYLSVRCDPPELEAGMGRLDYNALSRPGVFWGISLGSGIPVWSEVGRLLAGIAGPDVLWAETPEGWLAEGTLRTLRALRRGLAAGGVAARLGMMMGRPVVWVPREEAHGVRAAWHVCREATDAWRVALILRIAGSEVKLREGDTIPARILLPRLGESDEINLMARLSMGGLATWRLQNGPLEVLVPGRAAADAFESVVDDGGDTLATTEVLPWEEIEQLPAGVGMGGTRGNSGSGVGTTPVLIKDRPRRQIRPRRTQEEQIEVKLQAAAALAAKKRREELGIVSVTRRTGLDRFLVPREREAGFLQTEEDPRALLAEIGLALEAASRLGEEVLGRTRMQEARGAALAISTMSRRPDLSMARAFAGVRRVEGTVAGLAQEMSGSEVPRVREMASRLESLAWRVRSRINAGPPKVHLALTPEEESRLKRLASR